MSNLRTFVSASAIVGILASHVVAAPIINPFSNFNPLQTAAPFKNCTSKGKITLGKGKTLTGIQITLQNLLAPDGVSKLPDTDGVPCTADDIICLVFEGVSSDNYGAAYILRGEVVNGSVVIKHDLCKEAALCPSGQFSASLDLAICYEADPTYAQLPDVSLLAPDQCMGGYFPVNHLGAPIARPSTPIVARNGLTFACP